MIGYCTNVHAGVNLATAQANLERYACRARELLGGDRTLGIGLWLAEEAAAQAIAEGELDRLRDWLRERRLEVFTMNGFPQGNFHQAIVKHRVYEPTWWLPSRLEYTRNLVKILASLLEVGQVGSISTLPISWGTPAPSHEQLLKAAEHFKLLAGELAQLHESTGKEILIAIEPEPGCFIGDSRSLRDYFERYLFSGANERSVRRHVTVCHDVCHAAVMREEQAVELQKYIDLGIRVGKVQVSSAIQVDWDSRSPEERREAFGQLQSFAEDRYLHQTTLSTKDAAEPRLVEDLPMLLKEAGAPSELQGSWRVHFHVPIFAQRLGAIDTTQGEIRTCLDFMKRVERAEDSAFFKDYPFFSGHWEIETYAWSVLPKQFAPSDLAEGIASEVRWFEKEQ